MQSILGEGSYPGRVVGLGITKSGKPLAIYAISGRSEMSKQRRSVIVGNSVQIEPSGELTPEQEASKDLIIYRAIAVDEATNTLVVSNGKQTDPIFDLICYDDFGVVQAAYAAMYTMGFEPDSLSTPRVAGVFRPTDDGAECILSEVVANDAKPSGKDTQVLPLASAEAGRASYVATYTGDFASPAAPSLAQESDWVYSASVDGESAEEIAQELYDAVNADVRVTAVAAVLEADGWKLAIQNLHPAE